MIEGMLVLGILIIALALFATERVRVDLVALGIMVTLMVLGIISPMEGIAGFSNPATVTIAAMFVLSAGLQRTDVPGMVGNYIIHFSDKSETRIILLLMVTTAILSAFILNTAVVAVFIPIVLRISKEMAIPPSRLLIPTSFGAIMGGALTLIGTSTNLLISSIAVQSGLPAFGFFDFAPLGLITLLAGILYMIFIGHRLLPRRSMDSDLLGKYEVRKYLSEVVVSPNSTLVGKNLGKMALAERYDITVLDILRDGRTILLPGRSRHIRANDVVLMRGSLEQLLAVEKTEGLEIKPISKMKEKILSQGDEIGMAEVVIAPAATILGFTIRELDFRETYGVEVIGILRRGMTLTGKFTHESIMPGDMLLVIGEKRSLAKLNNDADFLLLVDVPMPATHHAHKWRAFLAVGIMTAVVVTAILGEPIVVSALAGALLMVATGILSLDDAYASLDKRVLVLLAGVLSLEAAMVNSGLAQSLGDALLNVLGTAEPWLLIGTFYLISMLLTAAMSNQATAVALAPLAISTAYTLHANPIPLLMAITFAASASFMTPVGYQTNTMIYNTGRYRFMDFTRVGLPLNILLLILSTFFIPIIWPLY